VCVCVCGGGCVGICVCVCACARKHMCVRNSEKKPSVSPKGGEKGLIVTLKEQVVARIHSIYVCMYVHSTYVCMSAYTDTTRTQYKCMYVCIHMYVCMYIARMYVCLHTLT